VWDGETGQLLANLESHGRQMLCVAVWKEHVDGREHDRIATADNHSEVSVWDGETFALLQTLQCGRPRVFSLIFRLLPFQSAEGPTHLLVPLGGGQGVQIWLPEEGRLLHDGINRGCPISDLHLFESEGRYLLAVLGVGRSHARRPGDADRTFIDVWDLGEAYGRDMGVPSAKKLG
jgi:hypothetical protein